MNKIENVTVIKSINRPNFEIAMIETELGDYLVIYEILDQVHSSELLPDYKTAAFLFDLKLQELEGH